MNSDYYFALKLQQQFKDEAKPENGDHTFALMLQEQFQQEATINSNSNNVSTQKKCGKVEMESSKCLVDPSWESIDPTPNINNLFVIFNERFFGNKLLTVAVSWSKRMTSCAGVCSYEGRGGMCSIRLSEPLLKLRPRKDLVETLLHEMIHAYLFVTHNNKDRDGHGPEFHKHMYRINKEAGTNITVYHDFHDEVRLYKQHWWKCNGPCQHRKPFYGMVRRATNRAPGRFDFWWNEHSTSCGGQFIKVKEPEKPQGKNKSGKENKPCVKPSDDIRNFINTSSKISKPIPTLSNHNAITTTINSLGSNYSSPSVSSIIKPSFHNNAKVDNIHTISNISVMKPGTKTSMNAGTIVINPGKASTSTKSEKTETITNDFKKPSTFSGKGHLLANGKAKVNHEAIKNKWLTNLENSVKRSSSEEDLNPKRFKSLELSTCCYCTQKYPTNEIIDHQSECNKDNTKQCPQCKKYILKSCYDFHLVQCFVVENYCKKSKNMNMACCPWCHKEFDSSTLFSHLLYSHRENFKECLNCKKVIEQDNYKTHILDCVKRKFDSNNFVECEICGFEVSKLDLKAHKTKCLQNLSDSFNSQNFSVCKKCNMRLNDEIYQDHLDSCLLDGDELDGCVACFLCNKSVSLDKFNDHLDNCMSDNIFVDQKDKEEFCNDNSLMENYKKGVATSSPDIFIDEDDKKSFLEDNSLIDEYEHNVSKTADEIKNSESCFCPICRSSVPLDTINEHLDTCLR